MSSLWAEGAEPAVGVGMIFLKKIFEDTNMRAEPKAHKRPIILEADMSNVHASMTPMVSGRSEMYVEAEYLTPNSIAYAATVNSGDKAWVHRFRSVGVPRQVRVYSHLDGMHCAYWNPRNSHT